MVHIPSKQRFSSGQSETNFFKERLFPATRPGRTGVSRGGGLMTQSHFVRIAALVLAFVVFSLIGLFALAKTTHATQPMDTVQPTIPTVQVPTIPTVQMPAIPTVQA